MKSESWFHRYRVLTPELSFDCALLALWIIIVVWYSTERLKCWHQEAGEKDKRRFRRRLCGPTCIQYVDISKIVFTAVLIATLVVLLLWWVAHRWWLPIVVRDFSALLFVFLVFLLFVILFLLLLISYVWYIINGSMEPDTVNRVTLVILVLSLSIYALLHRTRTHPLWSYFVLAVGVWFLFLWLLQNKAVIQTRRQVYRYIKRK